VALGPESNWNLGMLIRKTVEPGKKPSKQGREPTANSQLTYDTEAGNRPRATPRHASLRRLCLSGIYLMLKPLPSLQPQRKTCPSIESNIWETMVYFVLCEVCFNMIATIAGLDNICSNRTDHGIKL
jgi:hypothetical protein